MGEGKATLPENTKGFRYFVDTGDDNAMYVSIFPSKFDATVANDIVFLARSVDMAALSDYDPPARPAAATDPDSTGAAALAASISLAGVVLASLV